MDMEIKTVFPRFRWIVICCMEYLLFLFIEIDLLITLLIQTSALKLVVFKTCKNEENNVQVNVIW